MMTNKIFAAFSKFNTRRLLIAIALFFTFAIVLALPAATATLNRNLSNSSGANFPDSRSLDTILKAESVITVNSFAQSPGANGDCTLGEAIQAANANAAVDGCAAGSSGTDTIILAAGTYTFSTPGFIDFRGVGNAVPAIESDITIQGAGATSTIIERSAATGTPDFRFFHHNHSGAGSPTLTLNAITLRGGRPHDWGGGAIFSGGAGIVVANDCIFLNNQSSNWVGGAIYAANVTVNNSTFTGNSAIHGGAINTGDGPLTITNSTFTNNAATSTGGALSIRRQATISGSTFSNNTASDGGGALSKPGFFEPVIVSNSIFTGNTVTVGDRNGGAISSPNITLTNSTVSGNAATGQGGGIWSNDPTIIGSTISGNTADHGGGVYGQNITLENSTISGNFARQSGGGLVFNGTSSVLNINNATITNNRADSDNNGSGTGGGMFHTWSFSPSTSKFIRNSIIAGNIHNSAPDCADAFGAAWQSQGYNLIGNTDGCNFVAATGDQVGTPSTPINPLLGALQNNGGATTTHALLTNSPAIDNANPNTPNGTGNNCLPTDQRGAIRPGAGNGTPRCDIGAFEIVPPVATRLVFSIQPTNRAAGQVFNPAIKVEIQDQFGILMPNETADITIALANNPGNSTLSGTLTRTTVGGMAAFDDIYLSSTGTGYTLQAASGSLTVAVSSAFNISAADAAQLVFTTQPANTDALATMPVVRVAVQDQFGNTRLDATNAVTLAIENNAGSGTLSGTLTRTPSVGIAAFNDLSINSPANGYTLRATSTGLMQDVSDPFNITRPIFVVTKTADTNDGLCNADCSLREAITAANALNGADTINFNILGSAPFTITLASSLPDITGPVTIDGTSQSGYSGIPVVGINGSLLSNNAKGIKLSADNNVVRGLLVSGFARTSSFAFYVTSNHNVIAGNFIGTDFAGNSVLPNAYGIELFGSHNIVGGMTTADRNLISGNISRGLGFAGNDNQIIGNYIGTDLSGFNPLSNGIGVDLGGRDNTIGGESPNERNVISGNNIGIRISSISFDSSNIVQGNFIGRNAANTGNIGNDKGLFVVYGSANIRENVIAGNYSFGVSLTNSSVHLLPRANLIRSNSIYENGYLGISLTDITAPLPNDPGDDDSGANAQLNYPVLSTADLSGGNLTIQGSLNSKILRTFTLEFFSNPTCHSSGYGEGTTPLGTINVTTGASGIVGFTATLPSVPSGSFITATATDSTFNDTSEFSQCRLVAEHPFSISGRTTDSANLPIANLRINLTGNQSLSTTTDGNGNYSFEHLPDGVYTVAPTSTLYDFAPPSRTYTNPVGDQTNQNFVGTRTSYRVTGFVRADCGSDTSRALGQVNLSVSGGANQTGQTDAGGRAFFDLPPAGSYVLTPSFGNYSFNPANVALPNPLTGDLTIEFVAQSPVPLCSKFVTHEGSGPIRSMNADGSAFADLYSAGTNSLEPDLPRDGSRLTFVESGQVYVADFDGSSKVQLTTGSAEKRLPRLSPDKTKIVYQSESRLRLFNIATNTVSTINTNPQSADQDIEASWSPDGTKIVFHRIQGSAGAFSHSIFSVNVDGTNLIQLATSTVTAPTDKYAYPDWSPDGSKITFTRQLGLTRSIMVMNADGSNLAPVFSSSDSTFALSYPRWSPDGSMIVFVEPYSTGPTSFSRRLVLVNADGTGRIELQSGLFGSLSWAAQYQVPTQPGTNVPVQAGGVSISFAGVSSGGQTTANPIPSFSAGSIPGGFTISGLAYEITTTATYTPPISICFTVPETIANTQAQFSSLALMHNENGTLVDRTTSRDYPTRQICGTVNSLSPFALAEQIDLSKPQISGLVLDSNGNPMSGVQMLLTGSETKEAETNTDGTFHFVNLTASANYNVQPKQLGYIFSAYSQDFVNVSGEPTIVFTGTAGNFAISGRVTDANGNGAGNVLVQLDGASIETTTDVNGNYTFPGLPADGSYAVRAFNGVNNFNPSETIVEPLLSNVTDIDFTLAPTTPTAANGTVSGRVLDDSGAPVAGVVINLSGTQNRKSISNADGNYQFDNVETTGFYTVTPARLNYTFNPFNRSFSQLGNQTEAAFTASPSSAIANPLNTPEYFVRQHYLDFLGREPDEGGFNFWSNQMLECGTDAGCQERRRINVSAAYFLSIEFQETGGLVDGLYRASYDRRPLYAEFMPDTAIIGQNIVAGQDNWQQRLAANKQTFIQSFVSRAAFRQVYDGLSNEVYVDKLISHTRVAFSDGERDALVNGLNHNALTRADVLLRIAQHDEFVAAKRNEAFVMMEYFGYLRRDPDESGYQFWLNKLNQFDGNFERAEMVKAFINSDEYRSRFAR